MAGLANIGFYVDESAVGENTLRFSRVRNEELGDGAFQTFLESIGCAFNIVEGTLFGTGCIEPELAIRALLSFN